MAAGAQASEEQIIDAVKRAAAALRDANVPFALGGGVAIWARGGRFSDHDVDVMVREQDASAALDALTAVGMTPMRPPEDWLVKAACGDVVVDVIYAPAGYRVDDDVLGRAETIDVKAMPMPVLRGEDVLVSKLLALREHALDFDGCLEIVRSIREQLDFDEVRERTEGSPFARAFFVIADGLGITAPAEPER